MIRERVRVPRNGWLVFSLLLAFEAAWIAAFVQGVRTVAPPLIIVAVVGLGLGIFLFFGLFPVNPNEARVLQFFGAYAGTVRQDGLQWTNPLYTRRAVTLRVQNFETGRLKVNDLDGNPIEIAAIVVWKVVDTALASFQVENYAEFVHVQSEAALRNLATRYPYDTHDENQLSLRGHTQAVAEHLRAEIQERVATAGVEILEARISHLAYAPEIAEAMLRRQQAGAIVAARHKIVEGAVGMVEMALDRLAAKKVIELDEERRAAMISNLLVVLCSDRAAQPVVNTGTLYQ